MLVGMPSALRIYHGLDVEEEECPLTVRDGRMFLEKNYRNEIRHFERKNETVSEDAPFVMRMKDICFRYAKDLPDVLEGVALSVRQGEIISLLGGNGAGKTTLLKIISGTCKPYRGKIEVFGKRLQKYSGKELYVNKLAFLPQNPQTVFLKMTVREDYAEVRRTMGYSKEQMAQKTEEIAANAAHRTPAGPPSVRSQRRRAAESSHWKILLLQPKLLLLDEPTKGIDAWSKRQLGMLLKQLKQQGITIIMVTHDVEFAAEVSDRCGLFFDHEITSLDVPEEFFCNNNYYTTAANRISRKVFDNTITCEEVIALCRQNGKKRILLYRCRSGGSI